MTDLDRQFKLCQSSKLYSVNLFPIHIETKIDYFNLCQSSKLCSVNLFPIHIEFALHMISKNAKLLL